MNKEKLKNIAEGLIDTFKIAGDESIKLFNNGLEIKLKEEIKNQSLEIVTKILNNLKNKEKN